MFQCVILDLATDSSDNTCDQLNDFVQSQQSDKIWPENIHLVKLSKGTNPEDVSSSNSTVLANQLFDIKCKMDFKEKRNFVLVTNSLFKKFWENMCYHLFSPVHNWMVYGVVITDQPTDCLVLVNETNVNGMIEKTLMNVKDSENVQILRPKNIPQGMFNAGFSTRSGGVSSLSPLSSLNLTYTSRKVDPVAVINENRRRLAAKAGFDPSTIYAAKVEHGNKVRIVEHPFQDNYKTKYDCLVSNTRGATLFAPGADCCPILLADPKTGACGAVHAGWMGTVKGAVRSTLKTMMSEYGTNPADVQVAIGPSVGTNCFSLTVSSAKPLTDLDPTLTPPCKDNSDRVNVDLVRANAIMLEQDGVLKENIDTSFAMCTKCHKELFFSHERDAIPFGNHVGFISPVLQEGSHDC